MHDFDVIIAGGGPAGSSAAIHLARHGLQVLLVEQKKFPRPKLCGEFISPECEQHFQRLGVAEAMSCSAPSLLTETVFYSTRGQHVTVPSRWFGGPAALGLSRAVMDDVLLRRARECGVNILEGATISEPVTNGNEVLGVRVKLDGQQREYHAPISIDATGRARILTRKLNHRNAQNTHIAFKAHLRNTRVAPNACEIYFYPGGYGGLSSIEGGLSNLCFIISAEQVKRAYSDPQKIVHECVMKNQRAAYTLEQAQTESEWLSASWESFGRQRPESSQGLAGDWRFRGIHRSIHRQRNVDGFRKRRTRSGGDCSSSRESRHSRSRIRFRICPKVRVASADMWTSASRCVQTSSRRLRDCSYRRKYTIKK